MNSSSIKQIFQDSKRLRQVVTVLAKYGLARWLSGVPVPWIKRLLRDSEGHEISRFSYVESVRLAITELGTTFIKLGQILSTRADLIGIELAEELSQLRANVSAESVESVVETIEQELGGPMDTLFLDFDRQPLAAASIAQVHRATTHSGVEIVLKVQRTDIEECIKTDLQILMGLAELAERYSRTLQHYQPVATAAKFRTTLLRELDFRREREHMNEFNRNFAGDNSVHFAKPVSELSSKRVLAMEFLSGTTISDTSTLIAKRCDLKQLAQRGAQLFLDMIFRDGFYHADPHPGNLLVLESGKIGVLDCGMIGRIENSLRCQIEDMLLAVSSGDAHRLTRSIVHLGGVPIDFDEVQLENEVEEFIAEYAGRNVGNLNLSLALTEMIELIRHHQIRLPPPLTLLLKVLVMLEGTSRSLDPEFSLAELIVPYQRQALLRRFSPSQIRRQSQEYAREWFELLRILPSDTSDILDKVKRGKFDVHLDHRRLDSIVNRLVSGVLTAALFVGSAALWSQQVPPLLWGTSLPGLSGCVLSLVLGWGIHRAIRLSGSLDDSRH